MIARCNKTCRVHGLVLFGIVIPHSGNRQYYIASKRVMLNGVQPLAWSGDNKL